MRIFEIVDVVNIKLAELDVCVYLMSAVAVQMEVEEGANATVTELLTALLEEEELGLPRVTQEVLTLWMISPLLEVQLKPHHKVCFVYGS